jgi:hypothetical protein
MRTVIWIIVAVVAILMIGKTAGETATEKSIPEGMKLCPKCRKPFKAEYEDDMAGGGCVMQRCRGCPECGWGRE